MRRRDTILVDRRGLVRRSRQGTLANRPAPPRRPGPSWHGPQVGIQGEYDRREATGQALSMLAAGALMAILLVGGIVVQAFLDTFDQRS